MNPSIKKCMLWNAGGNIIYLATQWLVTILVTLLGGYGDAGFLSVAMSISASFQTLALFGVRSFQVSDLNSKYSDTTYVNFRNITSLLSLLLCAVASIVIGYSLSQLVAILLFMLFRIAESYSDVLHGIAQKNNRLDIAGKAFAIKGILLIAAFLAGYFISEKNLNVALLFMALSSVASTVLYDLLIVRRLSTFSLFENPKHSVSLAKETLAPCIYLFLFSAISTVPKLILEKELGETVLGIYSSVFAPAILIQAAIGYIYNPFIPAFAKYRDSKDSGGFIRFMLKISGAIFVFGLVMLILSAILGEFALTLIFGESIREHAHLLIPIILVTLMLSFMAFYAILEITLRDFKGLLTGCALGFAVSAALSFPFIRLSGSNGTSYAIISGALISSITLVGFILLHLHKKIDIEREQQK